MRKIVILIPVFNDWESFKKLIVEINENILNFKETHFECLIVCNELHSIMKKSKLLLFSSSNSSALCIV